MVLGTTLVHDNYFYTEWTDENDSIYAHMLYDHRIDEDENVNISINDSLNDKLTELSALLKKHRGPDFYKEQHFTYDR